MNPVPFVSVGLESRDSVENRCARRPRECGGLHEFLAPGVAQSPLSRCMPRSRSVPVAVRPIVPVTEFFGTDVGGRPYPWCSATPFVR